MNTFKSCFLGAVSLVAALAVATSSLAQEVAPSDEEEDFELEVEASERSETVSETVDAEDTQEVESAWPGEGAAESAVDVERVVLPEGSEEASEQADDAATGFSVPGARSPVGESSLPRSLIAEGSNYVRPLRPGLSWWGFVQAEYYSNQISENELDPDGHPLNQNQFGVRRGRLRIDHGWQYAFATLELDAGTFGGPNVQLRRAEASFLYRGGVPDDVTPPLVLTAGVTDVPFGAEIGESQRDRLFMERSLGSVALFPSLADGGVKLWGALGAFNYAVALVNGESTDGLGIPLDHDSYKDVAGRVGVATDFGDATSFTSGLSFYVGRGFSPGLPATKDTVTWVDLNNNGVTDPGEIQGVTGSAAIPSQTYERWAIALDASTSFRNPLGVMQLATEGFFASNLDRGVMPMNPILIGANSRQLGWMGSITQQLSELGALGFRAAYYDPNTNLIEQRAGVFHLRNQAFWVWTAVAALTLSHGRIAAQYDIVRDHLGRDRRGVPANVRNNEFTIRWQVDL